MRHKHKAVLASANGYSHHETENQGSGFLTKAQQDVLDAAVSNKQKTSQLETAKSHSEDRGLSRQFSQGSAPIHRDRSSRSKSDKLLGKPKKHGAGGKYNWGATLDSEFVSGAQDPQDPNYDSGTEDLNGAWITESPFTKSTYSKQAITTILREYLITGNEAETIASLQDLSKKESRVYVGKKLVVLSLDHRDKEREFASHLLSSLYNTVISDAEMEEAFILLLKSAEDLKLDVPQASEYLAYFIARAIIDDVLPRSFPTQDLPDLEETGQLILDKASHLLKAPQSTERIRKCWSSSNSSNYSQLADRISTLLNEYLSSNDFKEVQICLSKINAPLAMHDLVKQALTKAMASNSESQILALLERLSSEGSISEDQILKGFKRIQSNIDDLTLDIPDAKPKFESLCQYAYKQKWFPQGSLEEEKFQENVKAKSWSTSLQVFKKEIGAAILEYFSSDDIKEVKTRLEELDQPGFHSLAVKQIIQYGMEAKDKERNIVAKLLNELSEDLISKDQLTLGFKRLLASAEDIILDIPEAPQYLSIFLGRLIVDERLPPAALTNILGSLSNGSLGVEIIKATGNTLKQRHAYERLQNCWQPTTDLRNIRNKIQGLIQEYLENGDKGEVSRCWRELNVPFYGHQLVFAILSADFENPEAHQKLFTLLGELLKSGEISENQLEMGFERVQQQISDLQLDFPAAPTQFTKCKSEAENLKWLHTTLPNGAL